MEWALCELIVRLHLPHQDANVVMAAFIVRLINCMLLCGSRKAVSSAH